MEPGKTVAKAARVLEVINKYRKNPSGVRWKIKKLIQDCDTYEL